LPSLLQLSGQLRAQNDEQGVIYLGTFSKILAPGLRLGWVIGPEHGIGKLAQAKQGVDLNTATLNQMIAYEMMHSSFVQSHTKLLCQQYRERRDAMLAALEQHFPADAQWNRPEGGLFLWVTLAQGTDTRELLQRATVEKVAFVPGVAFHANGGGENTMRLNFSNATPRHIEEGIARLGSLLHASVLL
jgi:2-aminoadipate transaminase